jgi:hypothetical protein
MVGHTQQQQLKTRAAAWATGLAALVAVALPLGLTGCAGSAIERDSSVSKVNANRPDGEAYAGKGEVVLRLSMSGPDANVVQQLRSTLGKVRPETARMELRYEGLDSSGHALFSRKDVDVLADPHAEHREAEVHGEGRPSDGPGKNTQELVVNLRVQRQIHIQGRTIEILDAHPEGVVFRVYTDN